jgi:hypothetical protein
MASQGARDDSPHFDGIVVLLENSVWWKAAGKG